jgi:hypothetical protein
VALLRRRSQPAESGVCEHELRDARWESMADAGNESKIDHFICRACGQKLPKDVLSSSDDDAVP